MKETDEAELQGTASPEVPPGEPGVPRPGPDAPPPSRPLWRTLRAGWRRARRVRTRASEPRSTRYAVSLQVTTQTVDPVRSPVTGEACFQTSDDDQTVDLSRVGIRLRAECAPSVGTRLLLRVHLPSGEEPLELLGRARWTRVELASGPDGTRAVCGVGVEILGGSRRSLDRYARLLDELEQSQRSSVAGDTRLR